MAEGVLLGYAVGTGEPVHIPFGHMVVTGQTQRAGKTTTLEALVSRSGRTAIAFVTKRGEGAFRQSHRIAPFFREQADWVFVSNLIDATLSEKNKLLRAWLMKVCHGTKTLAEVQHNVKEAKKSARGFSESIYTEIEGYLDLVVPEIAELPPVNGIHLKPGLNVMDLSPYSTALQSLVIRSALEHVYEHEQGVITIIPEAWEFLPELRGSPAKAAAQTLIRKGGGLENFMWVDSQDLAGVWKVAVRAARVYLIGVQREANEVRRTLLNIPDNFSKPKAKDVATLGLGQFYACWDKEICKVYIQPVWMRDQDAVAIARGERVDVAVPEVAITEEDSMGANDIVLKPEHWERLLTVTERQAAQLEKLVKTLATVGDGQPNKNGDVVPLANVPEDLEDSLYETFRARLLQDPPVLAALLKLKAQKPVLEVETERPVVTLGGNDLRSWLATLLAEGFFDAGASGSAAYTELLRRGKHTSKPNVYNTLNGFASDGLVFKNGKKGSWSYLRNPDLEIRRK